MRGLVFFIMNVRHDTGASHCENIAVKNVQKEGSRLANGNRIAFNNGNRLIVSTQNSAQFELRNL